MNICSRCDVILSNFYASYYFICKTYETLFHFISFCIYFLHFHWTAYSVVFGHGVYKSRNLVKSVDSNLSTFFNRFSILLQNNKVENWQNGVTRPANFCTIKFRLYHASYKVYFVNCTSNIPSTALHYSFAHVLCQICNDK